MPQEDLPVIRQARSFQIRSNKSRDASLVSSMSWNTVRQRRMVKVRLPSWKSSFDKQEWAREAPKPTQFCFTTEDIEDSTTSSLLKEKRASANKRGQTMPNALLPRSRTTLHDDSAARKDEIPGKRTAEKLLADAVDVEHDTLKNIGRHPEPIHTSFPAVPLSRAKSMQHRSPGSKSRWSPRSVRLRHAPTERSSLIIRRTILQKTDEESCLGAEEMESFECIETYANVSALEESFSPRRRRSALLTCPGVETEFETPSSAPTSSVSPRQLSWSWSLLSRHSRGALSPSIHSRPGGRRLGPIQRIMSSLKSGRRSKGDRPTADDTPTGSTYESSSKDKQPSVCDSSVRSTFSSEEKQPSVRDRSVRSTFSSKDKKGRMPGDQESSADRESAINLEASRNDMATTRTEDDSRECTIAEQSPSMSDDESVSSSEASFSSEEEDDDEDDEDDEDDDYDEETGSIASNSTMSTRDSIVSKQWNGAVYFSRSYLDATTEYDL
jgi:hypothetical protein